VVKGLSYEENLLLMAVGLSSVGLALCSSPYVNGDCVVDILEIQAWALSFGTFKGEEYFNPAVDLNPDDHRHL